MSVRKRGGRWHFDFMIKRSRYRGTIAEAQTKQEAKDAEAAVRREVFEGTYGKPKGEGSFPEYAEQVFLPWAQANKRTWQDDEYRVAVLKEHFDSKSFREITPMLVERFKKVRLNTPTRDKRPRTVASVNRELACLSKIFSLAIRDGRAASNPCSQVKRFEEHNERNRYLEPCEEEALLARLIGPRAYLRRIVQIAINTGMRRGEILAMCWSWVDFARGYINIPSEATKNGKPRSIPMNQIVRDVLSGLQLTSGRNVLVFVSHKTGGMLQDVKKSFRAACDEAKLVNFRFHDLRHTAGTRLGDTGADPFVIAEVLGHSDLKMTKRYTHATDQRKREAVERIATYGRDNELRLAGRNCHKIVTKQERKAG